MQLHIRQKLKWLQIQYVTNSKLTEIYYDRTIYNEFQVDRNIQWNLNHENHATQPVDRKNWHLNSLAAIQFIPIYLCSGSSNPNAHHTEPSHVHNMIRDGGTHYRPTKDALCRAIAPPWSPTRCALLSPGAHAMLLARCAEETKRWRWQPKQWLLAGGLVSHVPNRSLLFYFDQRSIIFLNGE